MFYREAGEFKTSYRADQQTFPIGLDKLGFYTSLLIAFVVIPLTMSEYWAQAVFLPFLIFGIAAIGLNILTGYCGQVSLGSGGFMAVGAYACYKLMTAFPDMNILICVLLSGGVTAFVGLIFGLPSLRIKGFYLAVATLAAQFFLVWLFNKVGWFYNYSASGQITAPERTLFGYVITGAKAETLPIYFVCLGLLVFLAVIARNLTRGAMGRKWMAIRDMDIAAEIIGVNPLTAKLTAFAISSFYVGISGALLFALYLGAVEVGEAFSIQKSFIILFMIIIGGLGSIFGSLVGAAFMIAMPVILKNLLVTTLGWPGDIAAHLEFMIVGFMIIVFLILEPHGLAMLWQIIKEKLRIWPFSH